MFGKNYVIDTGKKTSRTKERKLFKFDLKSRTYKKISNKKVIDAVVDRVALGNLVYVTDNRNRSHSFTPDSVRVRLSDGTVRRYRGEPLSSIGFKEGAAVVIVKDGETETVRVKQRKATRFQRLKNGILGS